MMNLRISNFGKTACVFDHFSMILIDDYPENYEFSMTCEFFYSNKYNEFHQYISIIKYEKE